MDLATAPGVKVTAAPASVQRAQKNWEETLAAKQHVQGAFLWLGQVLMENLDNAYWQVLGHESFDAFLAQPELSFHRSTAYKCIAVYRTFVAQLAVDPQRLIAIGIDKLDIIRRVSQEPDADLEGWLHRAQATAKADLRAVVRQVRKGPITIEQEAAAAAAALAQEVAGAIRGMTITEVEYDQYRGLFIRGEAPDPLGDRFPVQVRVWGVDGTKAEVEHGGTA